MNKIDVIGLGFGDLSSITLGAYRKITSAKKIFLRTADHPIVEEFLAEGVLFQSFDEVYEAKDQFSEVYETIAERLIQEALSGELIVYAVPGHPMVAEKTVQLLLEHGPKRGIEIRIEGSPSFLDVAFSKLGIDPIDGFALLDGADLSVDQLHPNQHLLIGQVYDRFIASDIKLSLMEVYPDDYEIYLLDALGVEGKEQIVRIPLWELDRQTIFSNLTALYIPPTQAERILYRRFDFLADIIATLRSPGGCPWDQKQTHHSLRPYLIEETYEFLEALDEEDPDAMAEELGDILLQILLHSQIASEQGHFSIQDVVEHLTSKMIRRHPHVFGEKEASNAEQVVQNWEEIKKEEKVSAGKPVSSSILDRIPKTMPSLLQAYEQNKRAARVGFDWERLEEIVEKLQEELQEFLQAPTDLDREKEMGDLFFTLISISRFAKIHPELALQKAISKFDQRFRYVEEQANQRSIKLNEATVEEMNQWWDEAKSKEM
ncbi:bifunctional methyltransferase/pyrophosphohydrolase YabN [Risungbinella massiliensis]|uniref:nucleoside triphosphate pyrophosphohydrolase n=1 Tax=Risungbinella massiliensis TaxID=1329796 RepID=UPI0005CC60CC|nr:nucleoside triphosphate pyrophosphohydrolase [Risungbinella massiliensis]